MDAWNEYTITNGAETVTLTVTDTDEKNIYGLPISPFDPRVVFPRKEWKEVLH